jgi:acyl-CoA thioesterase FadM
MRRSGRAAPLRQRGWYAVVAAETIRFRRSLQLFQRFRVVTRVASWDAQAFLLEQTFWRGTEVAAEAVVRARFLSRSGGTVGTADVLALLSEVGSPPPLPEWLAAWNAHNASAGSPDYLQQRTPKL